MFIKVTKSGCRRYVQLVESYRDEDGRVKKRTVATLGRLDQIGSELESVISGLLRLTGRSVPEHAEPTFESARALGDVWALTELWNELGFGQLRQAFRRTRHRIDVEALVRVMVLNRLCDPDSKLGVLRWLETVSLPGIAVEEIEHQHLLRAMDALIEHQDVVDQVISALLRPLLDQELAVVFYDMTTIRAEGLSQQDGDVRQFGMAKEGVIARQFMLGVVQTADGIPLYHEVFDGNTAEVTTLKPTIEKVIQRFPIRRVIAVADRGLLSTDNLTELQAITLPSGKPLEFILAVPGRRYSEFAELLAPFQQAHCLNATQEVTGELEWEGLRLIVAHNPDTAADQGTQRDRTIAELEQKAAEWTGKLDAQDAGKRSRGRKLSDGGARARFYHEVCEAHLARIIRVDLKSELFSYDIDVQALTHARLMDGKLLLVTNTADLTSAQVIKRYKALADIERGFRVLKSEIEIGPVYHRLPDRIRAHAMICFMALVLYRVMRQRLAASQSGLSPERALSLLQRIQYHRVTLNNTQPISGISSISQEQTSILSALRVKKPTASKQLPLL
ncbi:transposase [Chromobacterium alkanivorans]|uniref:IS1634 family transposase n=1 Tax=Chromobacterium alkanivorans TaxID=1071719 RepID=UPI00216A3F6D|nr:IS1634 family transposase [Chromobacterium alkanivorans]MCS3807004.1 transposase [Chromobacterium alkanivorans]MCS3821325.1 transposase [Chromobacterium alkanivorans]MCS3876367.1 transposase [Chromobacterium alkanivorans]